MLTFSGVTGTGEARFDLDLRSLQQSPDGTLIYGITGTGGGLSVWKIGAEAALVLRQTVSFENSPWLANPEVACILMPNDKAFLALSLSAEGLYGFEIGSDGRFATDLAQPAYGAFGYTTALTTSPGGYVMATSDGRDVTTLWVASNNQTTSKQIAGTVSELQTISTSSGTLLFGSNATKDALQVYTVNNTSLKLSDTIGAAQGLGLDRPTDFEVITAYDQIWAIVAGGGSSSLSVARVTATGQLELTDHVIDAATTYFKNVTTLGTFAHQGRSYILTSGGDGGVSAFLLLPDGTLRHIQSLHLPDLPMITDLLVITESTPPFVLASTENGIASFALDLPDQGVIGTATSGHDILTVNHEEMANGLEGDDIFLIKGAATVTGGSGADIFRPARDVSAFTITDFNPDLDRLDLSQLTFLRSLSQIQVETTNTGATVRYQGLEISVHSASGASLSADEVLQDALPPEFHLLGIGTSEVGTADRDRMTGTLYGDTLLGGEHVDTIFGGAGDDLLKGGNGGDILWGETSNDTIYGNIGHDRISGGSGDDLLLGQAHNDRLWGNEGADRLLGHLGNDSLFGGGGDDRLVGGNGADSLKGDAGADYLNGGNGNDRLIGDAGNDRLLGATRNDMLIGGEGRDSLNGGAHSDTLIGGAGVDFLIGGTGNDRLRGGPDTDHLRGGDGADRFIFFPGEGRDWIYDFDATQDLLVLGDMSKDQLSFRPTNWGLAIDLPDGMIGLRGLDDVPDDCFIFI